MVHVIANEVSANAIPVEYLTFHLDRDFAFDLCLPRLTQISSSYIKGIAGSQPGFGLECRSCACAMPARLKANSKYGLR